MRRKEIIEEDQVQLYEHQQLHLLTSLLRLSDLINKSDQQGHDPPSGTQSELEQFEEEGGDLEEDQVQQ